ncbi:Lrp/AsnC family transcriptional regulator [Paraglaciecola arctica]|uniref:AsnC family transcriptional regulator n=1 Tax=Paraglaciecola arctica BSs20135 TaxID=493475 RepID=K6YI63_9ALTE|nr:Lrp/AsnC family transcriptional regulator [Paraglaciecola arctica]GAC17847.1 AsnC family transcriptional regulator [Paraglaciecola arctica BSs20135]|tara:strand:+ start:10626 stop:11090 length:465 start_codon:yes stop_codon:yes gene_type:complete
MKKLDNTDLTILSELYANSRITNKELSSKANVVPSTCLERVKKMQSSGVIKGFGVHIDYKAVGGNIEAMTSIRLGKHSSKVIQSFRDDLILSPEVIKIFYMGGEDDFLLHITVKDTEHLRNFISNSITSRDEVVHIETAIIYEQLSCNKLPIFE